MRKNYLMFPQHLIILPKNISAIAIEADEHGNSRYGPLSLLPSGAEITIIGNGFNSRTVKVLCNEHSYFVFLQDIEPPDSSYYLP